MGIFSFFRRKKAQPSAAVRRSKELAAGGHRGIAAGDRDRPDFSAENIAKWQQLTGNEVEDFVYHGQKFPVHSTNVSYAVYYLDKQAMEVEFLDGSAYLYEDVTEDEAIGFAKAQSKGGWVWDNLRVRGSRTQHRKKHSKIR